MLVPHLCILDFPANSRVDLTQPTAGWTQALFLSNNILQETRDGRCAAFWTSTAHDRSHCRVPIVVQKKGVWSKSQGSPHPDHLAWLKITLSRHWLPLPRRCSVQAQRYRPDFSRSRTCNDFDVSEHSATRLPVISATRLAARCLSLECFMQARGYAARTRLSWHISETLVHPLSIEG